MTSDLKKQVEESIKICFKVCYDNTDANKRIHEAFQEFAIRETDNNYLQAIKRLLEAYSTDWKYETLTQRIKQLEQEVTLLKGETGAESSTRSDDSARTFGRGDEQDE